MADDSDHKGDPGFAAAEWVVRLGAGPLDREGRRAFDAWLAASPDHAAAFRQAQDAWGRMGELAQAPGSLARHSLGATRPVASTARRRRFAAFAAMAASVAILIGISSAWPGGPATFLRADHRTMTGRTGSFTLSDGTRVDLGPASAIAVHYSKQERRVELLSGIAYFAAVPRAAAGDRPFVVEAANGTSQALGTRFQVDRVGDGAAVTVMEHDVAVSATDSTDQVRRILLSPGQMVRYDADGGLGRMELAHADLSLAWRQGQLVFDRAPLGQVVEVLNRYRSGHIVIIGDGLAAQKVSGVFDAHDIDGALSALAAETGARRISGPLLTALY